MTQKTILIVDDQKDIRATLRTILEHESYTVIEAENGDDCLTKLKKIKPDLILMDIMMPGTPVIDIVRQISGVKIVYISAVRATDMEKKQVFHDSKITAYIEKPFNIKEVITCVKKIIQ